MFAYFSIFESFHDKDIVLESLMQDPVALLSEMLGDTMYFHQAMQQDDSASFVEAVITEVNGHVDNHHWELIKVEDVPKDAEILDSVWAMKRKRNLVTNQITEYKERLNIHGGQQKFIINYWETYAPVVTWFAIRMLIVCAIVLAWELRQVDFIMAYAQAPIECNIYLCLSAGIEAKNGNSTTHVLKLLRNVYGGKQAGKVWADFLAEKLLSLGYQRSMIDECVFYNGNIIFMVYVDDRIFISTDGKNSDKAIKELQQTNLKIED